MSRVDVLKLHRDDSIQSDEAGEHGKKLQNQRLAVSSLSARRQPLCDGSAVRVVVGGIEEMHHMSAWQRDK